MSRDSQIKALLSSLQDEDDDLFIDDFKEKYDKLLIECSYLKKDIRELNLTVIKYENEIRELKEKLKNSNNNQLGGLIKPIENKPIEIKQKVNIPNDKVESIKYQVNKIIGDKKECKKTDKTCITCIFCNMKQDLFSITKHLTSARCQELQKLKVDAEPERHYMNNFKLYISLMKKLDKYKDDTNYYNEQIPIINDLRLKMGMNKI